MNYVHFDASAVSHADSFTEEQELEFRYGKQLLTEKHPVGVSPLGSADPAGYFNTAIRSAGDGADCSPD